jgi:predicted ATPase/class 3 adenylate cyclase
MDSATTPKPRQPLPEGTVTFLFTDIEGSTRLLQALGDGYRQLLSLHGDLMRHAIRTHAGTEVSTEGDSFFAAFTSAQDGVAAAVAAQRALAGAAWPPGASVKVRMGLHTGQGAVRDGGYVGLDVHRAARVADAAHGGQILLSAATRGLLDATRLDGGELLDLGVHHLRDIESPEHLYRVVIPGIADDTAPPRTRRMGNLPVPPTSFIGRAREREEVRAHVAGSRLVTLIGPGGTGKTRLAIQVATDVADEYADGAFFVPLDPVSDPTLLVPAISQALGLAETGPTDPRERLAAYLAERELLLVLDNFEQIRPAAATVGDLLSAAEGLHFLVTSRAALDLYGEQLVPVPPLSAPDASQLPPLDRLAEYESIALFSDRARAVQPGFAVTAANAAAVAEICARLDGLPLAIELAAARVRLLPPEAILARLSTRLDLLESSAANLPLRQRSLRGAMAWSYDLLEERDQRLLARLSVFAGGCDIDAASSVCNVGGELGMDLLDGLGRLVDNSLLRQRELRGEARFLLLQTIREFAAEHLEETGDAMTVRARHADWCAAFLDGWQEELNWLATDSLARIGSEHDNLRAAVRASLEDGRPEIAQRIVYATWRWWQRTGLLAEGRWWCDFVVSHASAAARTANRGKALMALGSIAYWQGDIPTAESAYQEASDIYHELDDPAGLADAIFFLSFVPFLKGDVAAGKLLLDDALDRYRAMGNEQGIAFALQSIGVLHLMDRDADAASGAFREALQYAPPNSIRRWDALAGLGWASWVQGDATEGHRITVESLGLAWQAGDLLRVIGNLEVLGILHVSLGHPELAAQLHGASQRLRDEIGGAPPISAAFPPDVWDNAQAALGGPDRFDELVAEGRALDTAAAVALAMSDATAGAATD